MWLELVCVLLCSLPSVTVAKDTCQCPEGFLQHRNACYWFSNIKGSFAEARSYCEFFQSHLAQITTKDENDFIKAEAKNTGRDHYRLGATDLMVRGTFLWEGGVALNYTNWDDGEPNNKEGQENCLEIWRDLEYRWNDLSCKSVEYFICEKRASGCCCRN